MMSEAAHQVGQTITLQFAWRIPDGDLLRALFGAEVQKIDDLSEKYVVRLGSWLAGRQESPDGKMRPLEEVSRENWSLVSRLAGQRISLSFEASDGRALFLRYETLTGEHNFFSRLNELPPAIKLKLADIPYGVASAANNDSDAN